MLNKELTRSECLFRKEEDSLKRVVDVVFLRVVLEDSAGTKWVLLDHNRKTLPGLIRKRTHESYKVLGEMILGNVEATNYFDLSDPISQVDEILDSSQFSNLQNIHYNTVINALPNGSMKATTLLEQMHFSASGSQSPWETQNPQTTEAFKWVWCKLDQAKVFGLHLKFKLKIRLPKFFYGTEEGFKFFPVLILDLNFFV